MPFYIPKEWDDIVEHFLCVDFKEDNTEHVIKFLKRYPPNERMPYVNLLKRHSLFREELKKIDIENLDI